MSDSKVKVALAQFDSELGNKQGNLQRMALLCEQAAASGAKLICFPELATTGYRGDLLNTKLWDLSDSTGSETYRLFSELATRLNITIVSGFVERGDYLGDIYNSVGVWNPGCEGISGVFRKVHAFGIEKQWFSRGDSFPVFDTPIGKIGIMICYDMGFPEVARILTLQGQSYSSHLLHGVCKIKTCGILILHPVLWKMAHIYWRLTAGAMRGICIYLVAVNC